MSVKYLGLVLDHLKAKPAVKLVAVVLADHADADGVCWPSYRRIAERTGLDDRTVRRHVRTLIELGVITKLRTGTMMRVGEKSVNVSNAYRMNEDVLRRFPMLMSVRLSTEGLGITETFDHPGVVKNTHSGGGGLSTKPSDNHHYNRQSDSPVDKPDAVDVGTVLGEMFRNGSVN